MADGRIGKCEILARMGRGGVADGPAGRLLVAGLGLAAVAVMALALGAAREPQEPARLAFIDDEEPHPGIEVNTRPVIESAGVAAAYLEAAEQLAAAQRPGAALALVARSRAAGGLADSALALRLTTLAERLEKAVEVGRARSVPAARTRRATRASRSGGSVRKKLVERASFPPARKGATRIGLPIDDRPGLAIGK